MMSLVWHLLRRSAAEKPSKEALVDGKQRLSYRDVAQRAAGLASGLQRAGVRRGDRVGVYLEPSAAQAISIFGVSQAEAVFVPINALLHGKQVQHIAQDCGCKALITTPAKLISLAAALRDIRSLEFVVVTGEGELSGIDLPALSFTELCGIEDSTWREASIGRDLAAILYTSGSTGKPKGVMLSHDNILAGSKIVSAYLEITNNDRILSVLPLSFDAGLNQLMTAFENGGTLVMIRFAFARDIIRTLLDEDITGLAGVPTFWNILVQPTSMLNKQPLRSLRYITNTGGTLPMKTLNGLREALPSTKIFLMYGLTEAFRSTYLSPEELDHRPTSIGKAIPDTEILVIDEQGRRCKPGETGELVHRGPTVSMGYWNRPEDTARALRPNPLRPPEMGDSEKVCYSGDLVRTDDEGFFYFVGRRDTLIKSSGFRISPTEIEETLFETGELRGVAVIGIPDKVLGQAIKAFVTPRNRGPLDTKTLLAHCADRLPPYMVPKSVEVLDELPKTASGKIDYAALRDGDDFYRDPGSHAL
jgi:acyl-CoA ligase (AMP-forming) (exosortase A-associated)